MTLIGSCCFLLLAEMFGRKLDKHVFERRADFVDLGVTDSDLTQLFVDLCALDTFINEQMHRLTENRGTAHAAKLMHGMESRRHVIASHIEPPCSGRIHLG